MTGIPNVVSFNKLKLILQTSPFRLVACHRRNWTAVSAAKINICLTVKKFRGAWTELSGVLVNSFAQEDYVYLYICLGKEWRTPRSAAESRLYVPKHKWKGHLRVPRSYFFVYGEKGSSRPGRGLFAEDSGHGRSAQTAAIKKNVIANPGTLVVSRLRTHTSAGKSVAGITRRCKLCVGSGFVSSHFVAQSVSGYIRSRVF